MIVQDNVAFFHVRPQGGNRGFISPGSDNNCLDAAFGVNPPHKEDFPSFGVENGAGHVFYNGWINAFGGLLHGV
jgi:hypothetical protein